MACWFCCKQVKDVASRPLKPSNIYQQFYIRSLRGAAKGIKVKPLASDGHVPSRLRFIPEITVSTGSNKFYQLDDDASGLDHSIRQRLPEFNFPLSRDRSDAVLVGKWYCPFVFVKEPDLAVHIQMRTTTFYKMTLKQQWVKIFSCKNNSSSSDVTAGRGNNSVSVDVNVEKEVADVEGSETETTTLLADRWCEMVSFGQRNH